MTPLHQLINFLTAVDHRIADIDRDSFLNDMIQLATDDAMLLHMHQGLVNPCDEESENDIAGSGVEASGDQPKKKSWEERQKEDADADFNGTYYDVRIKTHYFGTQRQIVFVFTNVSAEKGLQRELVMKQYM